MKLVARKGAKHDKHDRLRYVRADGSSAEVQLPRQGILPHDLIHYVVETHLPTLRGFTALVASGVEPGFAMTQTHDAAASLVPHEAVQVEAVVEALQSQLWAGGFDLADFNEGVRSACAARQTPPLVFADGEQALALHRATLELSASWQQAPFHGTLELDFRV